MNIKKISIAICLIVVSNAFGMLDIKYIKVDEKAIADQQRKLNGFARLINKIFFKKKKCVNFKKESKKPKKLRRKSSLEKRQLEAFQKRGGIIFSDRRIKDFMSSPTFK